MWVVSLRRIIVISLLFALACPSFAITSNSAGVNAFQTGNYKQALVYFKQAAASGNVKAIYNLGYMYDVGLGVTPNYRLASEYYAKAAKLGNVSAMNNLARLYTEGTGVNQDLNKALTLLKESLAVKFDSVPAFNAGLIYYAGKGNVKQDFGKAKYYFKESADHGDSNAQYFLGQMYLKGQGVPVNYQTAYNWCYKAQLSGSKKATSCLGQIYAKLTVQQIKQVRNGTFQMSELKSQ